MGTIATIAISFLGSGAVAALVTFYLNARKKEIAFRRRKVEELYLAFERFDKMLSSRFMAAYPLVKDQITWDEYNNITIKNADKEDNEAFRQTMMLIDIYFPEIKESFDRYYAQRGVIVNIMHEHQRGVRTGQPRNVFEAFHDATGQFGQRSEDVKRTIIAEARKITAADQFRPWKSF